MPLVDGGLRPISVGTMGLSRVQARTDASIITDPGKFAECLELAEALAEELDQLSGIVDSAYDYIVGCTLRGDCAEQTLQMYMDSYDQQKADVDAAYEALRTRGCFSAF